MVPGRLPRAPVTAVLNLILEGTGFETGEVVERRSRLECRARSRRTATGRPGSAQAAPSVAARLISRVRTSMSPLFSTYANAPSASARGAR